MNNSLDYSKLRITNQNFKGSIRCIVLIFTVHRNLVIPCGVYYNHHIAYGKFDLKVTTLQMNMKHNITSHVIAMIRAKNPEIFFGINF